MKVCKTLDEAQICFDVYRIASAEYREKRAGKHLIDDSTKRLAHYRNEVKRLGGTIDER